MFDHLEMVSLQLVDDHPGTDVVQQLRRRMQGMQGEAAREPVAVLPELSGLVRLRSGGSYRVEQVSLALALLAAPSRAGGWSAIVGMADLGLGAAAEIGVDLTRTVLVPDLGVHWLEATAALIDVIPMVLLRPPGGVSEQTASRIGARLRKRSSTLLVQGPWPGCEARLSLTVSQWYGADEGHGRLRARRVGIVTRQGSAPPREAELWLPALDAPIRQAGRHADRTEEETVEEIDAAFGSRQSRGVG